MRRPFFTAWRFPKRVFVYAVVYTGLCLPLVHAHSTPPHHALADSIRTAYQLPAVGYAVISADAVSEIEVIGIKKLGSDRPATLNDHFRIGSNTKAITAFIAALLVRGGKINWETRFFDLFPEWKAQSHSAYHHLTLLDLLSFRNRLPMYTYTWPEPTLRQITGDAVQQRMNFMKWFFQQDTVHMGGDYNRSNLSYVAAGLLLEKVSGQTFEQMVGYLGNELGITFGFGQPNADDTQQLWGHDANLTPEPPAVNLRLNWLMAAGNIHISLPDYARFLQVLLQGLEGKSKLMPQTAFEHMFYCRSNFALGWFWETTANGERIAYNLGNPGSFLSRVVVNQAQDRAYVVLTNCMTAASYDGTALLMERLAD